MSKPGSSTHTGLARCPGTSATRCRYLGTKGNRAATRSARASTPPGGRSKISTPPTCIGVSGSSRYRKDVSSRVSRSTIDLLRVSGSRYVAAQIPTPPRSTVAGGPAQDPPPGRRQGDISNGRGERAQLRSQQGRPRHLRERPAGSERRVGRPPVSGEEEPHL